MTIIEIEDDVLTYKKYNNIYFNKGNIFVTIIILLIIFVLTFIFSLLQYFEWQPIQVLNKFKRIKKNMNSWSNIINEKTGIEINKGRLLYLSKKSLANLQCLDFGNYYAAARLSKNNYLPEFIKRGTAGPWVINKAGKKDESAKQFCDYILNKYSTNTITCGTDMYEKLGYSGYFIPDSPCENAISVFSMV